MERYENDGSFIATVTRIGGSSGPVSATWTTLGITASGGKDYGTLDVDVPTGLVILPDGVTETVATIQIQKNNDFEYNPITGSDETLIAFLGAHEIGHWTFEMDVDGNIDLSKVLKEGVANVIDKSSYSHHANYIGLDTTFVQGARFGTRALHL
jgi:hypothetical protein